MLDRLVVHQMLKVLMAMILVLFLLLPLAAVAAVVIIILELLVVLDDLVDLAVVLDQQVIQVVLPELLLPTKGAGNTPPVSPSQR